MKYVKADDNDILGLLNDTMTTVKKNPGKYSIVLQLVPASTDHLTTLFLEHTADLLGIVAKGNEVAAFATAVITPLEASQNFDSKPGISALGLLGSIELLKSGISRKLLK